MKINEIIMKNIGPYKEETRLSFKTNSDKNIILIGGQNGSGKTTLLNAIKYGLFGNYALGLKSESASYIKTIKRMINYETTSQNSYVEINFDIVIKNNKENLTIKREWSNIVTSFNEVISLKKNQVLLNEDQTEEILQGIRHSFSPDLLKSFIYDGEKISHDIDEGTISHYLNEMFESAFNLNIFTQLLKDLDSFLNKKSQESKSDSEVFLFSISRDISKTKDLIKNLKNEVSSLEQKRDEILSKIKTFEKEIRLSGGLSKNEYDDLLLSKNNMSKNKEEDERRIKAFIETDLPIYMNSNLLLKAISKAKGEKTLQLLNLIENFNQDIDYNFNDLKIKLVKSSEGIELVHNLSQEQIAHAENRHDKIKNSISLIRKMITNRDKQIESINDSILKITKANSEHVTSLLNQKNLVENNLFNVNNDILQRTKKINDLESKLANSIIYYESETQKMIKNQSVNNSFVVGQKAIALTSQVKKRLTANKLEELSKLTLETFKKTIRKKNTISNLSIDSNFDIHVYDQKNQQFGINIFSAGEKQLLVSSIIYSIYKLSNRANLFIFDTPLARLDADNRMLFIRNIIKDISNQVIILSTDSEFVGEYYNEIETNISSEYLLKYLEDKKETKVLKEYFEVNS